MLTRVYCSCIKGIKGVKRRRPIVVCRVMSSQKNRESKPARVLNSSFLDQGGAGDKDILSATIVLNWKLPKLTLAALDNGVCIFGAA